MSAMLSPQLSDIVYNEPNAFRAFLRLEELFRLGDADQRTEIRQGWNFKRRWVIPGLDYSDRDRVVFTPLVGNDGSGLNAEARIETILSYHAIENARSDFRDNTYDIVLCYHSALAAGLDAVQLLEEAATASEERMASIFTNFSRGQPERRCLWNYGFRAVLVENGIAFEWIGNDSDYDSRKPERLDRFGREVQSEDNIT